MPTSVITGQHAATARMDLHQVARELVDGLGPTLVAALTGTKDRKLPGRWAKLDGPNPSLHFARRLQLGHRAWRSIAQAESDHVARQWFIGGNPLLGEATPVTAVRQDQGEAVIRAVEVFLQGEPDV